MTSISARSAERGAAVAATWLRRCWNCGVPIGARSMFCARCGARQRNPKRLKKFAELLY